MSHCSRSIARARSLRPLFTAAPSPTAFHLPFLYQTHSIGTRPYQRHEEEDIPFDFDQSSTPPSKSSRPPENDNDDPFAYLYQSSEPETPQTALEHHLPPETAYIPPSQRHRRRQQLQFSEHQTMTQRESEMFSHVLQNILPVNAANPIHRSQSIPPSSLASLFESVGPVQSGSEISFGPRKTMNSEEMTGAMARASALETMPMSMRAMAARAAGLSKPSLSPKEQEQEKARLKELARLTEEMLACETDVELLQWMDKHVFSMISSQNPEGLTEKAQEQKKEYGDAEYATANYSDLLVEGLTILRKTFGDVAGVVSLFEHVKRLGAESYVMGCSVSVYNVVIDTVWDGYRDWNRVAQLLNEMKINGVEGDERTLAVLRKIRKEVAHLIQGKRGVGAEVLYKSASGPLLESLEDYFCTITKSMTLMDEKGEFVA